MANDGSLHFDTQVDTKGFEKSMEKISGLTKAGMKTAGNAMQRGLKFVVKTGNEFEKGVSGIGVTSDNAGATLQILQSRLLETGGAAQNAGTTVSTTVNGINSSLGTVGGSLDSMNGTVLEKMNILDSSMQILGLAVYDAIQEPLATTLDSVTSTMDQISAKVASGALPGIQELASGLGTAFADITSVVIPMFASALSVIGQNIDIILPLFASLTGGLTAYNTVMKLSSVIQGTLGVSIAGLANPIGLAVGAIALLGVGIYGAVQHAKNAEIAYYNMGNKVAEAGTKFQEAKDKAKITEDYATEWDTLKTAVENNKLPADELANAHQRIKDIEQWFIDNYGAYISAEEEKNGIRRETMGLIQEQNTKLAETKRLELENQIAGMKSEIPGLEKNVKGLQAQNAELENQYKHSLTNSTELKNMKAEWENFLDASHTDMEINDKLKEMNDRVRALTNGESDISGSGLAGLCSMIDQADRETGKFKKQLDENNGKLEAGTQSLQDYYGVAKQLVEDDLGGTYEATTDALGVLQSAQDEFNQKGKVSEDTMKKLIEKFPDLQGQEDIPAAIATKMEELSTKIETAKGTAENLGVTLDGLPTNVDIQINLNVNGEVPQYAKGVRNAYEGPAIVNEKGRELIQGRSGTFRYVDSNGPALTYLEDGDRVYTASQTRRIMRKSAVSLPGFAGGKAGRVSRSGGQVHIGNIAVGIVSYVDKLPEAFEKAMRQISLQLDLGVMNQEEYYHQLEQLRDQYLAEGSDKWWDYTKEILAYERDTELKELERKLKKKEITEAQYYEALADYRDTYFAQGTEEWQNYTDEIEEYRAGKTAEGIQAGTAGIEQQFKELQRLKDLDILSEEQYYNRLADLRDKYYLEGSEEWQEYTDEITDHAHAQIKAVFEDLKSRESGIRSNLLNDYKLSAMTEKTTKKPAGAPLLIAGRPYIGGEFGEPGEVTAPVLELSNIKQYINNIAQYTQMLYELRDKMALPPEFFQELMDMGIEQGYATAQALVRLSNEELQAYLADWQALQDITSSAAQGLTKEVAKDLYGPEAKASTIDSAEAMGEDFTAALQRYFDNVPEDFCNLGKLSAQGFGDGFRTSLREVFGKLQSWLTAGIQAAAPVPALAGAGGSGTGGTTSYNPVYNFYSSGETTRQQLAAARNADTLERLRGGYTI